MYKKFGEILMCVIWDKHADRQTYRHGDCNTLYLYRGQ